MLKLAKFAAAAGLILGMTLPAFAATITDPLFSNGDTTIDAQGNSNVSGTFTLQVGVNEVCEIVRTQAAPQAFTDTSVGGSLGYQFGTYTNVPFTVKVSPNTGTYYPTVQCAGIYGGNRAVDGNDNVVVGPQGLGTIRVVANGSSGSTGSTDKPSWLDAFLASIIAALKPTPAPTPAPSEKCDAIKPYLSAPAGTYSAAGVQLQSALLLDNPYSIPALKPGSRVPMGFRGVQTEAALSAYMATYHCN